MIASLSGARWRVRGAPPEAETRRLARGAGIHPLVAAVLHGRGLVSKAAILDFLGNPDPGALHDPLLLRGMEEAVARIIMARETGERVLVHGDYDVDGVTSAVLVTRALQLIGVSRVTCRIPHRIRDGYGLGPSAAQTAEAGNYGLLIAVDCGTNDLEAVEELNHRGVDVLILDHHLPGPQLPRALALINPRQEGCRYPFTDLCSAGLAFKLAQALHLALQRPFNAPAYASVAALGTVADLVSLEDENRLLVRLGLPHLGQAASPGLRELLRVSGVEEGRPPTAGQVGYHLGPRINAAGRIDSAEVAARLLLTADEDEAREIARQLDLLNARRRLQETELVEQLTAMLQQDPALLDERILVLDGSGWPRGVIGIAASRLVEAYHRPAVVISRDDTSGHGSCRSIKGFNITGALEQSAADLLQRFGGHAMAAGLTVAAERIPQLRKRLQEHCRTHLDEDLLVRRITADAEARPAEIDRGLADDLSRLEPHGMGNPRPVFLVRGLRLEGEPRLLKDQHLKLRLSGEGAGFDALWWRSAELLPGLTSAAGGLDVLARVEINRWGGRESVQLNVSDARPAADSR